MISDEQYILIERYLQGDLTEKEISAFQLQLAENPEFAQEVQIHEEIARASAEADAFAFETLVKEVGEERKAKAGQNQGKTIRMNSNYLWGIAAGLALLLVGYFIWNQFSGSSRIAPQDLYAQYAQLEEQQQLLGYQGRLDRGSPISGKDSLQSAHIQQIRDILRTVDALYQSRAYVQAEFILDSLLQFGDPSYFSQSDVRYNLGITNMHLEEWEEAIVYFSTVIGDPKAKADWYSAMAYLRLNKLEEARLLLQSIAQDGLHPKQDAARLVLEHL